MYTDIKLDFADVLIQPKRSNIASRNDVSLENHYLFVILPGVVYH